MFTLPSWSRRRRPAIPARAISRKAAWIAALATSLTATLIATMIATPAAATVFVVDPNGGGDYTRIQDAILAAHHGDRIEVLPGEYGESLHYGGRRIVVIGVAGPEVTILEGANIHNLAVFEFGEPRSAVLEGFTLRNGRGRPLTRPGPALPGLGSHPLEPDDDRVLTLAQMQDAGGTFGGGVLCLSASPTLRNLIFEGNLANVGGGLFCSFSSPLVDNCIFRGNVAGAGAAIGGHFDHTDIRNSRFHGNVCVSGSGYYGEDSSASCQTSVFDDNVAAEGGGCYFLGAGNPARANIHHNVFGNNFAADVNGITGFFHDLDIHHNVFWVTEPDFHVPGAVLLLGGEATIDHCVFQGRSEGGTVRCEFGADLGMHCNIFYPGVAPTTCSSEPSNIVANPLFCDPTQGDFQVSQSSPCLPENSPAGCGAIGLYETAGCPTPRDDGESDPTSLDPAVRAARDRSGLR